MSICFSLRARLVPLVLLASWVLAGCGGGGGGGQGPDAAPSISLKSPANVVVQLPAGDALPEVMIEATVAGKVTDLYGRTIFALVEDPASLFFDGASVNTHFSESPPRISVRLSSRSLANPGRLAGNLKVSLCFDPSCASHLKGSPFLIPYDVDVAGVGLSQDNISITLPFGQAAPLQSLAASLPVGLKSLGANVGTPYNPDDPSVVRIPYANSVVVSYPTALSSPTSTTVSFYVDPAPVGTRTESVILSANIVNSKGLPFLVMRTVNITYTVTPNPSVDHAFSPATVTMNHLLNDPQPQFLARRLLLNAGVTATPGTVEYLSNPPAANGHAQVNAWWTDTPWNTSSHPCLNGDCLPAGTYTARGRYTLHKGGTDTEVYFPVTMIIVP